MDRQDTCWWYLLALAVLLLLQATLCRLPQVLQSKVEKLSSHAGAAVNEELEGMRLMMRCRVCRVRTKDTVITKCWHTFCSDCIKRNLDARNRKCPACGHLFGAQDVKQIYL